MRLGHRAKPRREPRQETIPSAPDSVSGVALDDATPRASGQGRARALRRALLLGAALASGAALAPFEERVRERLAHFRQGGGSELSARVRALLSTARGDLPGHGAAPAEAVTPARSAAPARPAPSYRPGRGPLGGAVFSLPEGLRVGAEGTVDVLIHFHGNTEMVLESAEHAELGAATVVVNLGVGSGPYEDRFDNPVHFTDLLTRTRSAIERRGVAGAKVGRLALSSWSAGYGAVLRILKSPALAAKVDAVILLDGMHVGRREDGGVNWLSIDPFEIFAERAVRGERLFLVTHSNIQPVDYLGVKETADHLLRRFDMARLEATGTTTLPPFASFEGVLPKAEMIPLTRQTEARRGGFIVRGFRGNEPHTHIAHLMAMSEIGLTELARRWRSD